MSNKITKEKLIKLEKLYGGYVSGIKRSEVSPLDHRTPSEIASGGMIGGDRMSQNHHNYAPVYEEYLKSFNPDDALTIVELGILKGSGLGMWSTLFPNSRVIGLDIEPSLAMSNMSYLKQKGANVKNIEIHKIDQLTNFSDNLKNILGDCKIDIMIDDGLHSNGAILNTVKNILPLLNHDFCYLIEDNATVSKLIDQKGYNVRVTSHGLMTVILPNHNELQSISKRV